MRHELTPAERLDLRAKLHYALGTQFGEVPNRNRARAVENVLVMHIEDLITERIEGVPDHVKRKQ